MCELPREKGSEVTIFEIDFLKYIFDSHDFPVW